jgi:hypothetical protein
MAFQPQPPFPKSRGDTIRSTDWNDLVSEVQSLGNLKIDKAGDTMTGPLTVASALGIGVAAAPELPLRVQTGEADQSPILGLNTPNNEDFLSIFGGRRSNQLPFVAWKRGDLRFGTATSLAGAGLREFLRINSSDSAAARVEVDGRIRSGQLTVGAWPASPAQYVFFGINTLDQTQAGNYALLQGTASDIGTTYLNSSKTVHLRINNGDKLIVQNDGNIDIIAPSHLSFGAQTRQMINLWSTGYGVGIQNSTLYVRSDSQFAWHQAGTHDDNADDPGATFSQGGRTLMLLDASGNLHIRGQLFQNNSANRLKTRARLIIIGPVDPGPVIINPSDMRLKQNVQSLDHALDRLLYLRGVSYEWAEPEKYNNQVGTQFGMIAQEVEEIFPQWVKTGEDGYKGLAIRGFEALTVEALRELKAENDRLLIQNRALELRIATVEAQLKLQVSTNGTH